ncbi:ribose-phosphate pyrophosphokinase [Ectothiorhodospiraceae bacterium WFHF3C12]|nr:ribose-phosphate pyrophosphokinase [Ectothiorhodospiraceae bacterium WFHF3C12]
MPGFEPKVFALSGAGALGQSVADALGFVLSRHEEREFEDGEHKARPLESVRGCDVYVLQRLAGVGGQPVSERLLRLLFFIGALRDAGAARVSAVVPYLAYARKDRRTKPRDPVTTRYVGQLFEAAGADRLVVMDVHNPAAFENSFRGEAVHVEARPLFVQALLAALGGQVPAIVSPDAGGYKRAERLRESVETATGERPPMVFLEKKRSSGVVSGDAVVGDVEGRTAVIVDDLIASGGTLVRAARACRGRGSPQVIACASHGPMVAAAADTLADPALDGLWVTNSVLDDAGSPHLPADRARVLDCGALIAEAIRRLNTDGSIVDLVERGPVPSVTV